MKTFLRLFFLMMVAMIAHTMAPVEISIFSGEEYENHLAKDKQKFIWEKICSTAFKGKLPPIEGPGFFALFDLLSTSFLSQAFTNEGDTMSPGRPKHIHSQGTTVAISFVAKQGPYTGIFSEGAPHGILRLSLAKKPSDGKFTPGLALKFFRNGMPSVNIMAMPSLDGQTDPNLFTESYTNVLPAAESSLVNYALECQFAKTLAELGQREPNPRVLPLQHLSETDTNGSIIFYTNTPYQIIFQPTEVAKMLMDNIGANEDFRAFLQGKGKNVVLFDVFVRDRYAEPIDDNFVGYIKTTSSFCASRFGDSLYFKHPLDN